MSGVGGPVDILYCIDHFSTSGGTERQLAGLIRRLDRSRFRPHVCYLNGRAGVCELEDCGYLALEVPAIAAPATLGQARRLWRYLRHHRVGVVQTFFQDATLFGLPVARAAGVPVRLVSFRDMGYWRTPRLEFLMRRVYPLATGFLANSDAVRQVVVERDPLAAADIEVIPNGMDPTGYRYNDVPGRPTVVGYVGNLNREVKRADLFVEAAGRLAPRFPDVRWLCFGDGGLRPRIEAQAKAAGLDGHLEFLGRRDDVPDLLPDVDIGVNCSDSEGMANAVLEYMLAGCAVVATDVGGNRETVRDGVDGLLVPPGDAAALAAALARLLADPALAAALRQEARRRVLDEFTWERSLQRHQDFYGRQLAEHAR